MSSPSPAHKEYIRTLLTDLREANRMTYRFDSKWKALNDELNHRLDRQGVTDIVQRTKSKGESIPLADALGSGKWWREKAMWLSQAILAEEAALRMLGGTPWTSPSSPPASSSPGSLRSWSEHL